MAFNPAFMPAGIFGAARKTLQQPEQPEQPEQRSGGFFGQGGTGRAIAGNIGDALMQMSGMRPIYNPTMQHQQKLQAAAQQAQAQRQAEWEDWIAKKRWEAENSPPDWAYEQDNAGNLHRYDKRTGKFDEQPVFVDPNDKMFMQDGQLVRVPNVLRGQGAGGGSASPPQGAVDALRSNPSLRDQFDAKYGAGAADRVLGGGGSNVTGGFPR